MALTNQGPRHRRLRRSRRDRSAGQGGRHVKASSR
jgi:hypothetical protein